MITLGPEANGFNCGIWNTAMIKELIVRKFSVSYNPNYISTLLKKIGLTNQKARFISDKEDEEKYYESKREMDRKNLT